jgi:hypothetical protein
MSIEYPFDPAELDGQLDAYIQRATVQDVSRTDITATHGAIALLQDVTWSDYCDKELPERRALWESTMDRLGDIQPETASLSSRGLRGPYATWNVACLRKKADTMLELTTSVEVEASAEGLAESGVLQAQKYLEQPIIGKKCPDALLGILATGGRFRKAVPLDRLQTAHDKAQQEFILTNAWRFTAKTVVKSLGSAARAKHLYEVELHSGWVDPNKRGFYLQPENAYAISKELGTEVSQSRILEFLAEEATGGQEIRQRFQQLGIVAHLLCDRTRE